MLTQHTLLNIANNPNFADKQLLTELTELFADKPEAYEFLKLYGDYGEIVDDVIDEERNLDTIETAARLCHAVNNCAYWNKWKHCLFLVERLVHNTYFDSVKWEKSNANWKRRDAKCLSHCGYNMLFAVILLEFGEETLNKFSLRFREHAHLKHINDPIYATS